MRSGGSPAGAGVAGVGGGPAGGSRVGGGPVAGAATTAESAVPPPWASLNTLAAGAPPGGPPPPSAHRDVWAAAVLALWPPPADEEVEGGGGVDGAWAVWRAVAAGPDEELAEALVTLPRASNERLPAWDAADAAAAVRSGRPPSAATAVRYAAVLTTVLSRPRGAARVATLEALPDLRLQTVPPGLARAVAALGGSPVAREAVAALHTGVAFLASTSAPAIRPAAAALAAGVWAGRVSPRGGGRAAHRRCLAALSSALRSVAAQSLLPAEALAWRAVGAEVLDVVVGCPAAAAEAIQLASALCPTAPFVAVLAGVAAAAAVDGPAGGGLGADAAAATAAAVAARSVPGRVERALRGAADPHLRRVALAALVASAASRGWDPARLRLLEGTYRVDVNPGVAGAAYWVDADEEGGSG